MSVNEIKTFNYLYWYKKTHDGKLPPNAQELVQTLRRECKIPGFGKSQKMLL